MGGYGANGLGISPVGGIEEPPLPMSVHSFWIGHVTNNSAIITGRIENPRLNQFAAARIRVSNDEFFNNSVYEDQSTIDQYGLMKWQATNLSPNTRYYIRITIFNSALVNANTYTGSFKTAKSGTLNNGFKLAFGSCSDTASNALLFDNLRTKATDGDLDFFIHLGDMHYRDIVQNQESRFQDAYNRVFGSPRQNNCWKNLPMYYMWDDHDYGSNDTDKNSPSRNAAIAAYRRRVPYPPLAITADSTGGVGNSPYFSFVRGRVRFIVTDLVSEREPKGAYASTSSSQKIFSDNQRQWFFDELLEAKDNNEIIVWANTKPWVSSIQNNKDDWGGYHYARMEIVNFINTNELTDRIVIISGDMHALAYDDGTSPNNYGNLKVCHGAPLDQQIRFKGGPYTVGPIATNGSNGYATQYGILEINDTGEALINVRFKGVNIDRTSGAETTPIDVNFDLNSGFVPVTDYDPYSDYVTLLLNFNT